MNSRPVAAGCDRLGLGPQTSMLTVPSASMITG